MKFSLNKHLMALSILLAVVISLSHAGRIYSEDKIVKQKLVGIWWTFDSDGWPQTIQFNENGTFRTANTLLRLEKMPKDEGRFQLEGTSLTLISNKKCASSCRGLKGHYKVEYTTYGKLQLNVQEDQCMERKDLFCRDWEMVVQ